MNRQKWTILASALGMLMLILDSQTALSGAREGIEICIRTLIPSLFPFFLLSNLMTGNLSGISFRWMQHIEKWFRIPKGTGYFLILGYLAGYPVGAKNVWDAHRKGQLSASDAVRLTALCNNAGPAFLFGVLTSQFSNTHIIWALWATLIISSLLTARMTSGNSYSSVHPSPAEPTSPVQALEHAIRAIVSVCGWVILFRILLEVMTRWLILIPAELQVMITGMLELANGCLNLQKISSEGMRFIIAAVLLTIGGGCVILQTGSVCRGLPIKQYLRLKCIQSLICYFLSVVFQFLLFAEDRVINPISLIPVLFLPILLQRTKKSSSIPASFGV